VTRQYITNNIFTKGRGEKRMKELLQFLLGIVLMIAGGVMFLKNVVVSDWGLLSSLFRIGGGVSIGGIFIVLLVIAFIALLVKPNMGTGLVFTGLCIAFFVCIVISLNVSLRYMSGLELTLILGTLCVGIAFVIKGLFGVRKLDREESRKKGKAASDKLNEYDNM
jgi:prepilin signal peptidase PulO-like enzyme (type II secretory pathway)